MWHDRITNGPDASTLIVYAKTEPTKGSKGISTFMLVSPSIISCVHAHFGILLD
jgi:hypothetical protein